MATPLDWSQMEGAVQALRRRRLDVDDLLDDTGNVPAAVVTRRVASLRPTADVFKYAMLWERLWDDRFVDGYQAMARWVEDQIPIPETVMRQIVDLMLRQNLLTTGEVPVGSRPVRLGDISNRVLNVMAERVDLVPLRSAAPLGDLLGSEDYTELRIPAGHIGLAVGRADPGG